MDMQSSVIVLVFAVESEISHIPFQLTSWLICPEHIVPPQSSPASYSRTKCDISQQ